MIAKIRQFLQGKKTYISAAALALAACIGWWIGAVDNTSTVALLTTAGGLAGLAAKSERAAQLTLAALSDVRDAQQHHAAGQRMDARAIAVEVARQIGPQVISAAAFPQNIVSVPIAGTPPVGTVTFGALPASACIFCGALMSLVGATGTVCTDPRNNTQPDTVGNRHHVFFVPSTTPDNVGGSAK